MPWSQHWHQARPMGQEVRNYPASPYPRPGLHGAPRYRRVATTPMPALVPNIARLCRFPGRDAGFGAQRGFCHPLTLTLLASVIVARADGRW